MDIAVVEILFFFVVLFVTIRAFSLARGLVSILGLRMRSRKYISIPRDEVPSIIRSLHEAHGQFLSSEGFTFVGFSQLPPPLVNAELPWCSTWLNVDKTIFAAVLAPLPRDTGQVGVIGLYTKTLDGKVILSLPIGDVGYHFPENYESHFGPFQNTQEMLRQHRELSLKLDSSTVFPSEAEELNSAWNALRETEFETNRRHQYEVDPRRPDLFRHTWKSAFGVINALRKSKNPLAQQLVVPEPLHKPGENFPLSSAEFAALKIDFPGPADSDARGRYALFLVSLCLSVLLPWLVFGPLVSVGLVVVLLIHEFGHYYAMRVCGYKDPTIAFFPFLGAVTTSMSRPKNWWAEFFVVLAGPLPGIFLALSCFLAMNLFSVSMASELIVFLSMLLVINYFNLLPIMPLDGGHVLTLLMGRPVGKGWAVIKFFASLMAAGAAFYYGFTIFGVLALLGAIKFMSLASAKAEGQLFNQLQKSYQEAPEAPMLVHFSNAGSSVDDFIVAGSANDKSKALISITQSLRVTWAVAQQKNPPRWIRISFLFLFTVFVLGPFILIFHGAPWIAEMRQARYRREVLKEATASQNATNCSAVKFAYQFDRSSYPVEDQKKLADVLQRCKPAIRRMKRKIKVSQTGHPKSPEQR